MTATVRTTGAVALQVGFYLYVPVVVAVPAGLAWWLVSVGAFGNYLGRLVVVALALLALLFAIAAVRLLRRVPLPRGVAVSEPMAPDLWTAVRDLAAAVDSRPPDEIRLVAEVTVAVVEDVRLPGLRAGRHRILALGLPLLQVVTVSQLRALVAHELSHDAGSGRLLAPAIRGAYLIRMTMAGLESRAGVRRLLLSGYARLYRWISGAAVRAREAAADAAAVRLAGREPAISALAVCRDTALAWPAFRSFLRDGDEHKLAPERMLGSFPDWLAGHTEQMRQWQDRPDLDIDRPGPELDLPPAGPPPRSRWDPHPPEERIARMEREPAGPNPDDRPATALLSDPDAVADELDRLEFAVDGYDRLPPDEYAREAERRDGRLPADRLYRAAARVTGTGSLETVLDLLATGQRDRLAEVMLPPAILAEPEDVWEELLDGLRCAVFNALVDSGAAEVRPGFAEPVGADGVAVDYHGMAERALAGEAAQVRDELAGLGVDLAAATAEHPVPTPHGARVEGVVTGVLVDGVRRDMVVMDLGVTLLAQADGSDPPERPAVRDAPPEELAAMPGHRYLAYEEVAAARPLGDHRESYPGLGTNPEVGSRGLRLTALRPFREEFILRSGERLVFEADEESRDDLHGGVYFLQRAEELTPVDAQEQA